MCDSARLQYYAAAIWSYRVHGSLMNAAGILVWRCCVYLWNLALTNVLRFAFGLCLPSNMVKHSHCFVLPVLPSSPVRSKWTRPTTSCSACADDDFEPWKIVVSFSRSLDGRLQWGCLPSDPQAQQRSCPSPAKRNTRNDWWLQIQTYLGIARKT